MNKQDREYIEDIAKQMGQMPEIFSASVVMKLWGIIDRLDKQLTEIVEAGEPFSNIRERIYDHVSDDHVLMTWLSVTITAGTIRRLAEALKGVKDE